MPRSIRLKPLTTHDQLDRQLGEDLRQRAQILDLDAFRRQLERTSGQTTFRQTARPADAQTTNAETQLRHELNLAFADLGGAAFALAHHGALNDKRLAPHVQRIHELFAQLEAPTSQHDHSAPSEQATTA